MSGGQAIRSDGSPLVGENLDFRTAHIDHGFDGECHAGFEFGTATAFAEIRNLRILVKFATDAMTYEFTDDTEAIFDGLGLHKI